MNKACLYQRANSLQRRDAKQVLDEFAHMIQWRPDGNDSLLDIGCGSGDVTIDYILPLMPINFQRLIGVDISEQMIKYACDNFKHPDIKFYKADIGNDIEVKILNQINNFDHITSFYCLHWVQNQKRAVENIYNLLNQTGDCLLTFLAYNPIFDIYEKLSKISKWSQYMYDVKKFISPYQYSKNPAVEFGDIMYSAGFSEFTIEIRDKVFIYDGVENLKKCVKAVNPFLDRMPYDEHDNFLNDYVNICRKMNLIDNNVDCDINNNNNNNDTINENDLKFSTPYKLIIVYGRK